MSLFTIFNKKHHEVAVVFDIGSASVGGALVILEEGKKPEISYSERMSIPQEANENFEIRESSIIKCLDLISQSLAGAGLVYLGAKKKEVQNVFIFVSHPWVRTGTNIFRDERKESIDISPDVIEEILKSDSKVWDNLPSGVDRSDIDFKDSKMIEKKVVQIKLNGYRTDNPYSKKAKNIEASIFTSLMPRNFLGRLEKVVGKTWSAENMVFHSTTFSLAEVLKDVFGDIRRSVVIDITGDMTEVFIMENGAITRSISFWGGRNLLVKKIIERFDVPYSVAVSFIRLYIDRLGEREFLEKLNDIVGEVQNEWGGCVEKKILELTDGLDSVPSDVFVNVMPDVAEIFSKFIESIGSDKIRGWSEKNTVVLDKNKMSHFVDFKPHVNHDPFLATESIFLNKMVLWK